jgi:dipeptidyl-peptidase-4
MGLRGRLSVLSEGYSNADFGTRVRATFNFVREVLSFAAEQRAAIKASVLASDRRTLDSIVVRSVLSSPTPQLVIAEITKPAGEGSGGFARRERTGVFRSIRMPVFDRFTAARKEAVPFGYLIPPRLLEVAELLRRQGVLVERLSRAARVSAYTFTVDTIVVGPLFEGHRTIQAEGSWNQQPTDTTLAAGWLLVRPRQPLGLLAAYLLEPASEDGVVTWNLLDRELQAGSAFPVLRLARDAHLATVAP